MHGDLERLVGDQVLQARALAGVGGQADHASRLGVERVEEYGGKVAARVAVRVLDLEPQPDRAVLADQGGRGAREQGAELDGAVAVGQLQWRRGRRDELAQRDEVGLTRKALERSGHEDRRGAVRTAVAGLVAPAGATGAGLAGTDGTFDCRSAPSSCEVRLRCRDFFPMHED